MDLRWLHERSKEEKVNKPDLEYSNIRPLKCSVAKVTASREENQDSSDGKLQSEKILNF